MRQNYKTYPTDYIEELKRKGKRKKARAFFEYWSDMEEGEHNSVRFYANSWEVSVSTAHAWIDEFNREIDLFLSGWQVRNRQHYTYAKNQAERQPNTSNTCKAQNQGVSPDSAEHQPNEVFNIYDDDKGAAAKRDRWFEDLYFIYRLNTKHAGKKEEAYREWELVKDRVGYENMKLAIMMYLHDPEVKRRFNFTNFLKNDVYLSYLPKRIKILIDGKWHVGTYDDESHIFKSEDGFEGYLDSETLIRKFSNKELEFVR